MSPPCHLHGTDNQTSNNQEMKHGKHRIIKHNQSNLAKKH